MEHGWFEKHGVSTFKQRSLIALTAIGASCFVGVAVAKGYAVILLLPALIPFAILVLNAQEKMIFPVIVVCFLAEYTIWLLGLPENTIYIIHLMILAMFGAIFVRTVVARESRVVLNAFVLAWMTYLVILLFVNSSLSIFSLQKLVAFFLYPLLFLAVLNARRGELFDKRVLFFLLFFVALQFPVVIVQKVIYWEVSPDRVGGTLRQAGGTHLIAILMADLWCFLLAHLLLARKRRPAHYLLLPLPFIPLALGGANGGFLLALGSGIVVYGVYFLLRKTGGLSRKVRAAAVIILPVLLAYYFLVGLLPRFDPKFAMSSWGAISSIDGMIAYMSGYAPVYQNRTVNTPANRLEQIKIVVSVTKDIYLGNGLGSLNDSPLLSLSNDALPGIYKVILSWATSLTVFLLETGAIGVLLYVGAILSLLYEAVAILRRSSSEFWRVFSLGFAGVAAVMVVSSLYADPWRAYPVAGSFWICAAVIEREYRRMRFYPKRSWESHQMKSA